LFEVHFGDLPGQVRFALLLLLPPLVQGLLVSREGFSGSRSGERLLREMPAKLSELVEGFTQVRIAATEDRIPLRRECFSAESLARGNGSSGCACGRGNWTVAITPGATTRRSCTARRRS
jgi:hypothetical protein